MRKHEITMPELGLIAGTRVAIGVGLGLLMSDRFSREHRREVGWTLLGLGLLSTIPLAADVLMHRVDGEEPSAIESAGEAAGKKISKVMERATS